MTIVTSYDVESDTWTHHPGDTPARVAFRNAVSDIALKAKATLPDCHGRVDSAVKLVLAGDVELLADGKTKVASQSNGTTAYHLVNGSCDCKDFPKAPSGWCKHRIAAGLHKRAVAQAHAPANGQVAPASPPTPAQPLPEAPASVNCHVTIAGRQVQVTLRGSDEVQVMERLTRLLERYPVPAAGPAIAASPPTPSAPPDADVVPTCPAHGTRLLESKKAHGTFFCPVQDDGKYCQVRWPAKASR